MLCAIYGKWMVNSGMKNTEAGNYQSPTPMDCISWVSQAWKDLKTTDLVKKAKELSMTAEPGSVVEGYVAFKTRLLHSKKPMFTSLNSNGPSQKMRSKLRLLREDTERIKLYKKQVFC